MQDSPITSLILLIIIHFFYFSFSVWLRPLNHIVYNALKILSDFILFLYHIYLIVILKKTELIETLLIT